ncbi:MAG TPA: hypothetical protein VIJ95_00510 [Hanamia sp.]
MNQIWQHIHPSDNSLQNISKGNYILKFKNTDGEGVDLHKHNQPFYDAKQVNKNFVEAIYLVTEKLNDGLNVKDITQEVVLRIPKEQLENGLFYFSNSNVLDELLPYSFS